MIVTSRNEICCISSSALTLLASTIISNSFIFSLPIFMAKKVAKKKTAAKKAKKPVKKAAKKTAKKKK